MDCESAATPIPDNSTSRWKSSGLNYPVRDSDNVVQIVDRRHGQHSEAWQASNVNTDTKGKSKGKRNKPAKAAPKSSYDDLSEYRTSTDDRWIEYNISENKWEPICSRFDVECKILDGESNDPALVVRFQNSRGENKETEINLCEIDDQRKLISKLRRADMWVADCTSLKNRLISYINRVKAPGIVTAVTKPGWYDGSYISPLGDVTGPGFQHIRLRGKNEIPEGRMFEWQHAAECALLDEAPPHFALGIFAGLAGPLVELGGYKSPILNFSGTTSRGKTTALGLAASAWGTPEEGEGVLHSLRTTDNGAEKLLESHSGCTLCLDEVNHLEKRAKLLQRIVYMIGSNKGKKRDTATGEDRATRGWKSLVLMSSEVPLRERIKLEEGADPQDGTIARSVDIDISDAPELDLRTMKTIEQFKTSYGHAGPVFIQWLRDNGYVDERSMLTGEIDRLVTALVKDGPPLHRRSATILALLWFAGRGAQQAGLIPADFDVEARIRWAWANVLRGLGGAINTDQSILTMIREGLLRRRDLDIVPIDCALACDRVYRESKGWYDSPTPNPLKARYWYVTPGLLEEILQNRASVQRTSTLLYEDDAIVIPSNSGRNSWPHTPGVGALASYRFLAEWVEDGYYTLEEKADERALKAKEEKRLA